MSLRSNKTVDNHNHTVDLDWDTTGYLVYVIYNVLVSYNIDKSV